MKHLLGLFLKLSSDVNTSRGTGFFVFMIVIKNQFLKNSKMQIVCHQVYQSKMKKSVKKIYFPVSFLSFAFVSLGQMVAHIYWWSQCGAIVQLYNMMKSLWSGVQKTTYDALPFIGHPTLRIPHISQMRM